MRLKDMARLNRAFNLGRVPTIAARILRKLDQEGLLGKHLFVVSPDQRRRLVDATQVFEAWREVDREFRHSYRGALRWKTING